MKTSIYKFLLALGIFSTLCITAMAVAPLPGLNLVEPQHKKAPFNIVSHDAKTNIQRIAPRRTPNINLAPKGLLILVNYADITFNEANNHLAFDSLANSDNYTHNGATGSCKAYFKAQSNGLYEPRFDVVGPINLPKTSAYYADNDASGNDRYVVDFVVDACMGADALGVDFSQYDNDNNGIVDFIYIIYAGYAESEGAGATTMWPHNWDLISALYYGNSTLDGYYANSETDFKLPSFDGKLVNAYACSNELRQANNTRAGIGTICHEFSHVLGLPDYYLTTTSPVVQQRETPGAWSLMGYGNYLNDGNTPPNYSVYDKYFLGWLKPEALTKTQTLEMPADGTTTYMLANNEKHVEEGAYRTDTAYYIENRQQEGWDAYLPGHGMLIWRVIFNEEDWKNNSPNDYVARYRLISAKSVSSPYTTTKPKPEVPFPGSATITKYAPFSHNYLENIQETSEGLITFDFVTVGNSVAVENVMVSTSEGIWYNILGQPIDPKAYRGIAIHNNKKYLLR